IGRARMAVEHSHFAENFAFANDAEHDVATVGRRHTDLDAAADDAHEAGAGIALGEDDGAARDRPFGHVGAEPLDHRRSQFTEERMVAQQRRLVERSYAWSAVPWSWHRPFISAQIFEMPEQPATAGQPRDTLQHLPAGAEGRMSH